MGGRVVRVGVRADFFLSVSPCTGGSRSLSRSEDTSICLRSSPRSSRWSGGSFIIFSFPAASDFPPAHDLPPPFPAHREEQHDDQLLYELLRCVKALSTSLAGSAAIRSCSPNPFVPLTALLFTDKKPGDVPTRQIITELLLLLFDLYPSSPPQPRWPGDKPSGREYAFALPREYETLPGMVRSLLVGPQKEDEVVEFVSVAHRKRVFKTYLAEISDIW